MNDAKPRSDHPSLVPVRLMLQPGGPAIELKCSGMVLGRHTEADVRLPLPDVSRRHCRFIFADNAWHIEDLGSLNGVFVNGQRVQQATLHETDIIGIGGFVFQVQFNLASSNAPAGTAEPPETSVLPMPTQDLTLPHRRAS
jgi:pSer/pThr/pTyr-binding forkhead associated (FHA) protein